jgi:hypothetical protein
LDGFRLIDNVFITYHDEYDFERYGIEAVVSEQEEGGDDFEEND